MSQSPLASKLFVHMGQSLLTGAHILPSSLLDHVFWVGSGVRLYQASNPLDDWTQWDILIHGFEVNYDMFDVNV